MHVVKLLHGNTDGTFWSSTLLIALESCKTMSCNVINMPFVWDHDQATDDALQDLYENHDMLFTGESFDSTFPGNHPSVMSVVAINSNKQSVYSSGTNPDIAAPGSYGEIVSTLKNSNYGISDVFSSASHVAGVAALVWSHFPTATNKQIRACLEDSAEDLGPLGKDAQYGNGLIRADLAKAYCESYLQPTGSPSLPPTSVPSLLPSVSRIPSLTPSVPPTMKPTLVSSALPSVTSMNPSSSPAPSSNPSMKPSLGPTLQPSSAPSVFPSSEPSSMPSIEPTGAPSLSPSDLPSLKPILAPSSKPSAGPSQPPTATPTGAPSNSPSLSSNPSYRPSIEPTDSLSPSVNPTLLPTAQPTFEPSLQPSKYPTLLPSIIPSNRPTFPSAAPSSIPSFITASPSMPPTHREEGTPPMQWEMNLTTLGYLIEVDEEKKTFHFNTGYNISDRFYDIKVLEKDCLTPTNDLPLLYVNETLSDHHNALNITFMFNQTLIQDGSFLSILKCSISIEPT